MFPSKHKNKGKKAQKNLNKQKGNFGRKINEKKLIENEIYEENYYEEDEDY